MPSWLPTFGALRRRSWSAAWDGRTHRYSRRVPLVDESLWGRLQPADRLLAGLPPACPALSAHHIPGLDESRAAIKSFSTLISHLACLGKLYTEAVLLS